MATLKKKNIGNDQVGATKILLENNTYLRGRNAANSADVNIAKVNASNAIEFASVPQTSGTPSGNTDFATVGYVAAAVMGLGDFKDAVRVASTADVALTGGASLSIDSVSLANGDRVLLKNQSSADENGIYVVSGIGTAYSLDRSEDANVDAEVTQGMSVDSIEGTVNALKRWVLTTADPIVLDTTSLTFTQSPIPFAITPAQEVKTLSGGDITAQYVDLAQLIKPNSLIVTFNGLQQEPGVDYTLSTVSLVTRVTFAGDLATGGASELIATDKLVMNYSY